MSTLAASLPAPNAAFHWTPESWGVGLRCIPLAAVAQHVFTSRQLELPGQDGTAGWVAVARAVGVEPTQLRRVQQVHGCAVHLLTTRAGAGAGESDARPDADALVSAQPGVAVAVVTADCVPVLLADPHSGAVAAVHAGWRGTQASIVRTAVRSLCELTGAQPAHLIAAIGPSIGPCCYTVGGEVRAAFAAAGHDAAAIDAWFSEGSGDLRLDLWTANRQQLVQAGVPNAAVFCCELCTACERATFQSYRVEGRAAGRMAAVIVTPPYPDGTNNPRALSTPSARELS